jgi:hypothetical protein
VEEGFILSIFKGLKLLLESPSGTFATIMLAVLGVVTYHQPSVGGVALAAFASVIPTILAITEHREQMQQQALQQQYYAPAAPLPPTANLPDKGSL